MTVQQIDISAIIGTYGLAVALVIIMTLFGVFKIWPWFTEDQKRRREVEASRHVDYIETYKQSVKSTELLNSVLVEFSTLVKEQHQNLNSTAKDNHSEVVGILRGEVITRLDKIDRNTSNGFGRKQLND